ncbi:hypothetical protein [Microbispora bryophytorum]|uniref:DUF4179 domain-containing protein n=1 Tax=Microbispora bryophytorum subsp. camponoti TaxID=1677852 RepID=A0ABR8L4G1_9ACTN|nr:hypothetical protein [Microbispora camponoti]MBD3144634.1 hypothetical protein [Microbispora camponoti]
MTGDITDLTAELKALAQAPAPPMTLDLPRARETGRRRLRRRRTWTSGAVGVAVLAVVLAAMPHIRPAPEPTSAVTLSTGPALLIAHASFGWLPEQIAGVGYQAGPHGDQILARGRGDSAARIILSLYPGDREPEPGRFADGAEGVAVSARVRGRPAYWLTHDASDPLNGGDTYLRWQTAGGRWSELHAYYLNVADPQEVLLRVAADVTVGDRPVPLPLRIGGLPSGLRVQEVQLWRPPLRGTGAWELQLFLTANGLPVTVSVSPAGGSPQPHKSTCTSATGLDLCVQVDGAVPASLRAIGGPRGLLDHITVLGTDERDWTTHVIG